MDNGLVLVSVFGIVASIWAAIRAARATDESAPHRAGTVLEDQSTTPPEIRKRAFEDPDLGGFVVAYEFSASDESAACSMMDGRIFKVSNPVWRHWSPPLHCGCNSVLIPITKVDDWDGVESEAPAGTRTKRRPRS